MNNEKKQDLSRAVAVGVICIASYLASYWMRNLLSVATPEMLSSEVFSKEFIGALSSVYFIVYAVGQLLNGTLGDILKPRIMVATGLSVAGLCSIAFAYTNAPWLGVLLFALMGFSLSMLRGPLVKTICENTRSDLAHVICVFLSFSGFVGPLIASLLAMLFDWRMTFTVAGIACLAVAVAAFIFLGLLERKGIVRVTSAGKSKGERKNPLGIFKLRGFAFYMVVSFLCEIATASISFWVPTYLVERLGFSSDTAGFLYSAMSFVRSFTPFVALLALRLFRNRDIRTVGFAFVSATLFFILTFFITYKYVNVALLLLALISMGIASSMLWSVYIPNQAESGLVSTLNGFLDFTGYAMAAIANMVFSYCADLIGWDGIVIMWISVAATGVLAAAVAMVGDRKRTEKN